MKASAILHTTRLFACTGVLLLAASYAPAQQSGSRAPSAQSNPAAFADALTPTHGGSCGTQIPTYDELQPEQGVSGSVHITYVVNAAGHIDQVVVDRSSGYQKFDDAARNAILRATCTPYVVDGIARRAVHQITIDFAPHPPSANQRGTTSIANPSSTAAESTASSLPSPSNENSQDAALRQLNIAPNSVAASQVERWTQRADGDPDIRRFLGPNMAGLAALNPSMRTTFFSDGELRLSPEDRSRLVELTVNALDSAPLDCGGVERQSRLATHSLQLAEMSDKDLATYLDVRFAVIKRTALGLPPAQVTEDQRTIGILTMMQTLQGLIHGDADAARNVAEIVSHLKDSPPEVWCKNARTFFRAVLATPQPYRDWMILAGDTSSKARRAIAHGSAKIETISPQTIASVVLTRVTRNIAWPSYPLDVEAAITIRCTPAGALLSETISRSSGNAAWDAAVLQAVQASSPFPVQEDGVTPMVFNIVLRSAG
ncbi:TonB family protein [Burkholderia sp. L27(2015)]|uniref:TonB family protein n=1 Tax=Burkholderia sp. L27(2015) TaxID=1641858 RepID=UPI00131E54FD|nr:TonB family protein [Burkholderia sp. L27(2015)]